MQIACHSGFIALSIKTRKILIGFMTRNDMFIKYFLFNKK